MFDFAEVGGAVRDHILGVDSKDVDFVAVPKASFESADDAFRALVDELKKQDFEIFLESPKFFTVRARVPKNHNLRDRTDVADFVLARKDGPSSDGRRPDFVLPGTLLDDLQRRDFTVNAIAILDGKFVDPFGGMDDIKKEVLRFVGCPRTRIEEDGLRVMRALRFSVSKNFSMTDETFCVVNSDFAATMLHKVSVERIAVELDKMFKANTLLSLNLISNLIPNLKDAIFRDGLRMMPTFKD